MEKLESVQYSAALAVTGAWKGTSREKLYEEVGWECLSQRRWSRRLVLFYKIVNDITPDYTKYQIPQLPQAMYSFRNADVTGQIRARTTRFKASFYPDCLSEWNTLDQEIRLSPSLSTFTTKLSKLIRSTPKLVYGIHDPKGLAILTQLRVGLSKLNFHKFRHIFIDTVNSFFPANDEAEDTEHFLLLCHSYDELRSDLLNSVNATLLPHGFSSLSNEVLLKFILYCDDRLTIDTNKKLLEATLKFIHAPLLQTPIH